MAKESNSFISYGIGGVIGMFTFIGILNSCLFLTNQFDCFIDRAVKEHETKEVYQYLEPHSYQLSNGHLETREGAAPSCFTDTPTFYTFKPLMEFQMSAIRGIVEGCDYVEYTKNSAGMSNCQKEK